MNTEPYPNSITLSLVGIDVSHDAGYTVNRRKGSREYLFEFFDGPVLIQDKDQRRQYSGNVFILYAPGQTHYFRTEGPSTHTWFQIAGDGVLECIEHYQIPLNQAISVEHPDFLKPLLKEAIRHQVRKDRYWEDAVTEVCRTLLRNLARTLQQNQPTELSPYEKLVRAELHRVRIQVYQDLTRRWSVADMAGLAHMSASRFAVVYRRYFGTGPIDDLIDVRLRHAEILLQRLPISIADAAHYSGFNSASHFHVLFRERMGRAPSDLRLSHKRVPAVAETQNLFENWEAAKRVNLLYLNPLGCWSFDQITAPILDDLNKHVPAILHNEVAHVLGHFGGQALQFDGTSYAVLPEAVVDTSKSYTVSAWLRYHSPGRMTAISVGNTQHCAFYLQYISYDGGFRFAVTISDRDPLAIMINSALPTQEGHWYHVTGIHDLERQEIRLYINGILQGRASYRTPWRADDATYFGCCQLRDRIIDHWIGAIDDVRIYDRALSESEIEILVRSGNEIGGY